MAKFRKIDPRIWNDKKFRALSDDGQLAFLFLLTHPHMTSLGAMRASLPGLAAEKHWTEKRFREAFQEGSSKGMAKHDEEASLVWLPNFIRYNRPESPNVLKAWGDAVDLLPECALKDEAIHSVKVFSKGLSDAFKEALPEAFSKAMPNPEPEPEPEQEKEPDSKRAAPRPADVPPEFTELKAIFPQRAGSQPWPDALKAINARLREGYTWDQILDGARRYARYIRAEGDEGTRHVLQAKTFCGRSLRFMEPFDLPASKADRRLAGNLTAAEEFMQRTGGI